MKKNLLYLTLVLISFFIRDYAQAQIITFPYIQDFEAFTPCGGSCTSTCALQDNWVNAATATRDFGSDSGGTSSSQTGPSVDHTLQNSSGTYLYAEASSPCYPTSSWHLESPTIDLTGTNDIQFTFWYHMYGQSMGTAHIDVSNDGGVTWTLDVVPAWTDDIDLWQQKTASLGAFTGVVTVRIRYEDPASFYGDLAIDDVLIYDLLQDDAGISTFITPNVPTCSFNDSVEIELTNFGTDTLFNVNINWQLDASVQTPLAWTGILPPNTSLPIYLGSVAYTVGSNLISWTDTPNGVVELPSGVGNDTSSLIGLNTGLNGIYTIGATGDYLTFNAAITDINTFGLCGPTIFDVEDGTYNEQLVLGPVVGMGSLNTVTFRSQSGDQNLVTVSFAATISNENYVVALADAHNYNFEKMTFENTGVTFGRVFDFQGNSDWNSVSDCHLITPNTTTTSTNKCVVFSNSNNNNNNCSFINNIIEGGSYGIYWYGTSISILSEGTIFENNELLNNYYYGSRLYYVNNTIFTNNKTHGESAYTGTRFANYFYYCDGSFEISGNEIYGGTTSGWYYGIYLGQSDGATSNHALIANNMIQTGLTGSTSTMYGIYLTNSGSLDIHSNNVLITDGGTSSRALYATGGGANEIHNNNFINNTAGYGIYLTSSFSITGMNYNNIYSPLGNVGYFGSDQLTLADWQTATGFDVNSHNVDPMYASSSDLHICNDTLKSSGIAHSSVTTDFDGQLRGTTPDVGADEFTVLTTNFLGNDTVFCTGELVTLSAGAPNDTILWSTGDTTMMIEVSTAGTYFVSVNGNCGIGADTIEITMSNLVYTNFLMATDSIFCEGDSTAMNSSMIADSYNWSTGSTSPSISVSSSGLYSLDITDNCGTGSESINITVLTTPIAGFTTINSYLSAIFTNTTLGMYNTYLWDFGDGSSSTEENPTHIFLSSGPHTVSLTVTNECGSNINTSIVSMVGIEENTDQEKLSVYPNPSTGTFTISMITLTQSEVKISVKNILGKEVFTIDRYSIDGSLTQVIDLSKESIGIYFVHIEVEGNQMIKKIIIK